MIESQQQHQRHSNDSNSTGPMLWTHVVKSRKKGNNKKEQIVSFNPTLITRPVTEEESAQNSLNGTAPPAPVAVIRPFIKGMEQDSVLIDLTPIKDRSLLNKALLKFNEEADNNGFVEDFLGYRRQTRKYLGHEFLETMWTPSSPGRQIIIDSGITLDDGTFIKGFPSYPADATIVRLKLENLPFLPAIDLKEAMAQRLSDFGDVLDHGISKTDGIFHGEGYATLNLTVINSTANQCQENHTPGSTCSDLKHLEQLARVIIWDPLAIDPRKILLQWDTMPNFCRNCQASDHCRADCPDYKKWVRCYHCNRHGHVAKNCDRNNSESVPAKVRVVENPPSKTKERKGNKANTSPKSNTKLSVIPAAATANSVSADINEKEQDHLMGEASHQSYEAADESMGVLPASSTTDASDKGFEDTLHKSSPAVSDAEALNLVSRDVTMERSPPLDPTKPVSKFARRHSSSDVSSMRSQSTSIANDNHLRNTDPPVDNDQSSLHLPASPGPQPPLNH